MPIHSSQDNAETADATTDALLRATARRLAAYAELPGLGDIRADRSLPIRERRHSVPRKAIR